MINPNPYLSIVIPTFNRAEMLNYCLGEHIPLARANNIQIFIFDNASPDETEAVVKKRIAEYPLIRYHRHKTNVGPDANFEYALKQPETDYIWLLGDSYLMPANGIYYLLSLISIDVKKYDMFLFNISGLVKDVDKCDYEDKNLFLNDLFWLTNCMSCLIYSRELINNANFERYRNTYFIQTGIIFEYICNKDFKIHWTPNISLALWDDFNGVKKLGWQSNVFEIWFKNRTNFIFSLPASYELEIKLKLAMETYIRSKVTLVSLLGYRSVDVFDYSVYKKYKYLYKVTMPQNFLLILVASLIPREIPIALKEFKFLFKKILKRFG